MTRSSAVAVLVLAVLSIAAASPVRPSTGPSGLVMYPNAYALCGGDPTAKFAKCRPQIDILQAAVAEAERQDKGLLIEVGADWCASCLVFDRYFNGWFVEGAEPRAAGTAADARALSAFMARSFVVARLNTDQADVQAALRSLGLRKDVSRGVPAFYVVYRGKGRQAHLLDSAVQTPRRGTAFSRPALAAKLRQALRSVRPEPASPAARP